MPRNPSLAGRRILVVLSALALLLSLANSPSFAAPGAAFTSCSTTPGQVYVAQGIVQPTPPNPAGTVYTRLERAVDGGSSLSFADIGADSPLRYNAIGYNENDNYIYGVASTGEIVQIDSLGGVTNLGPTTPAIGAGLNNGAIDSSGTPQFLYAMLQAGGTLHKINLTTLADTTIPLVTPALTPTTINIPDFTFIDGKLWGKVAGSTNFARINPATGVVNLFPGPVPMGATAGANWTYGNGVVMGISSNGSPGTVYRVRFINPSSASPTLQLISTSNGPISNQNDGASCGGQPANVGIAKTATPTVAPNGTITWNVTVTNYGPGDASGFSVSDPRPSGVTGMTYTAGPDNPPVANPPGPQCAFNATADAMLCNHGPLTAGNSVTYTFTGTAPASGTVLNTAEVIGNELDTVVLNDTASATTTIPNADLQITKTGPSTVGAGGAISWNLVVKNNGLDNSSGYTVSDTVPAGVTGVSTLTPGCSVVVNTVTCTGAALASGATASPITITGTAPASGTISNTATVTGSSNESDTTPGNNSSTQVTNVIDADLQITKTGPATVNANGSISWNLVVKNNGGSNATGVTVVDTVPTGVTGVTAPGCTVALPTVTCVIGALASGATASTITISGTAPSTAGSISNSATVSGNEFDSVSGNNTDSANTTVVNADLQITKSGPATVNAGGSISWNLVVKNNGGSNATGVTVTDTVPAGVTGVTAPGCTVALPTVTCVIGALASGATASTITISGTAPSTAGSITNSATVGGNEYDGTPANNTDSANTTVVDADLQITKTGPATVPGNGSISWNLVVKNNGGSNATGVTVVDTVPAGVTGVTAPGCAITLPTVTCSIGALASGATAPTITISGTAPSTAGSITNSATVSGNEFDSVSGNNSDSANTNVVVADLQIVKAGPNSVTAGGAISWTLTVTNNGGSNATGVTVTDNVPGSVTGVSSPTAGCSAVGNAVTCTIGALANGASTAITINGTAPASGSVSNTANVSGNEFDNNTANNTSNKVTNITPAPPTGPTVSPPTGPSQTDDCCNTTPKLQYSLQSTSANQAEAVCQTDNTGPFWPCGTDPAGGGATNVNVTIPGAPLDVGAHQIEIWAEDDATPGVNTSGAPNQKVTWRIEPPDYETFAKSVGTVHGYWQLDEDQTDPTAKDVGGSGRDGDYKNYVVKEQPSGPRCERRPPAPFAPTTPYACGYNGQDDPGSSAYFGGRDDHVQLEHVPNPSQAWTVNLWVKPDYTNESRGIFEHIQSIWTTDDNRFACKPLNEPDKTVMSAPLSAANFQKWHQVTCVLANGDLKLYVDGALANSIVGGVTNGFNGGQHQGFIGLANQSGGSIWFKGDIDDVTYYSSAVSANSIKCLWQTGAVHDGLYAPSAKVDDDVAPPVATIPVPADGAQYSLESTKPPVVTYSCGDPQYSPTYDPEFVVTYGPTATCAGPQANGATLTRTANTATTFTVNTTDAAGNANSTSSKYYTHVAGQGFRDLIRCVAPALGCLAPEAYYRFEDAPNSPTMKDEMGAHDGEYKNDQNQASGGLTGDITSDDVRRFLGAGGYGYTNGIAEPHTGYTLEGWFKPSDVAAPMMLLQHGGSGAIYLDDGSAAAGFQPRIHFRAEERDSTVVVAGGKAITAGDWWHVVATYDGITAKLYVNKQATGSTPLPLPTPDDSKAVHLEPSGFDTFYVGYGDQAGGTGWFRGDIDEVSYYTEALSAERVKEHYDADPPSLAASSPAAAKKADTADAASKNPVTATKKTPKKTTAACKAPAKWSLKAQKKALAKAKGKKAKAKVLAKFKYLRAKAIAKCKALAKAKAKSKATKRPLSKKKSLATKAKASAKTSGH